MNSKTNISGENGCVSRITLVKYLKGELSGAEMNSVERHLSGCEMCADELEGLGLLENPNDIDSIERRLNQRIDTNLANKKFNRFLSPLRIAASILIIVAITSLIYYTSTLTPPTNTITENILAEEEQEIDDSITLEPIVQQKKLARKKEEREREIEEERDNIYIEEIISYDNQDIKKADIFEINDSSAQMDTPLEQSAGAPAIPSQARQVAESKANKKVSTINIVDDDVNLFEVASIMHDKNLDSNTTIVSYIAFSDEEEEFEEEEVFILVEEMPSFIHKEYKDFSDYIAQNLNYPTIAAEGSIQGRVLISFIVEPDGSVTNVKVIRGVDQSIDEEAVRVVKSSPKWKPGTQRGKPVRVSFTFPVTFVLQ